MRAIIRTSAFSVLIVILLIHIPHAYAARINLINAVESVTANDQKMVLNTDNPQIQSISPDWQAHFLSLITDPTLVYLLLLLGLYGLFFELVNPGHVLPGVLGALFLCMALYAFQLLPINYAGVLLIILGLGFISTEAFIPAYGSLGGAGTIAFVIGSLMLFGTHDRAYHIAWYVIWAMALVNILLFVILLGVVIKTRHQSVKNGLMILEGAKGRSLGDIDREGQAVIRGEIWSVRSQEFIAANKPIYVIKTSGLILEVKEDLNNQGE